MKYPKLIRKQFCNTPISVEIYTDDINEDGEPIKGPKKDLYCNYQNSARRILTDNGQQIEINGVALFDGDPFSDISDINAGEVIVLGEKRRIHTGRKSRNPDGTVNYVKLELI